MTNEEAKKDLECAISNASLEYFMKPIKVEVIEKAVCALEKQIPQKLITSGKLGICPWCKCYCVARNGRTYNYCPLCGQAFDWSEDEG